MVETYPLRFGESNRVSLRQGDKGMHRKKAGPEISAGALGGSPGGLTSPQMVDK
jgi:hypothetical protein